MGASLRCRGAQPAVTANTAAVQLQTIKYLMEFGIKLPNGDGTEIEA